MGQQRNDFSRNSNVGVDMKITLGSLSHVGMKRSKNQDRLLAIARPNAPKNSDALLAVADGMGGHLAGEVASAMAIDGLFKRLSDGDDDLEATQPGFSNYQYILEGIVKEINTEVYNEGTKPSMRGMGTTLTVTLFVGWKAFFAHVGDSRAYLLRDGQMSQITQDHSWVAESVAHGLITKDQAWQHPKRNILTRAIGQNPNVEVDTGTLEMRDSDVVLLCSDGLNSLVPDEIIGQILMDFAPQDACDLLVQKANELGGSDNVSVVAIRLSKGGGKEAHSSSGSDFRDSSTSESVKTRLPSAKEQNSTGLASLLNKLGKVVKESFGR